MTVERPREDWTYRIVNVRPPNGMEVLLEELATWLVRLRIVWWHGRWPITTGCVFLHHLFTTRAVSYTLFV